MSNMYIIKVICGVLTLIRCSGESNTCSSYCSQTQNRESLPAASRTALLISSFSVIRSRCRGGFRKRHKEGHYKTASVYNEENHIKNVITYCFVKHCNTLRCNNTYLPQFTLSMNNISQCR